MSIAIIVLGFDITHAVLTLTSYKPSRVVVILALVNGRLDPRSSIAFSSLEQVATSMRIAIERLEVEVVDPLKAVEKLRNVMEDLAKKSPIIIDLGGGLRLLVIETFLAYLSLPSTLRSNSKVVVYIEGTNEARELTPEDLKRILTRKTYPLTYIEESILQFMEEAKEYTLRDIHIAVRNMGFNVSKQYIHKVLKKLVERGLISHVRRGRYIKRP